MQYPALLIDRVKFRENATILREFFARNNKSFHAVTKCFCAYEPMLEILAESGIRQMGDSRLENLARVRQYAEHSLLLRIPMLSEVSDVVRLSDASLNSEWEVIGALSDAALTQNKRHGVILMLELGDRREGVLPEEAEAMIEQMMSLRGIRLIGLGANFNCYGGVIPDEDKMKQLAQLARRTEERYRIKLDYVSGGNSGSLWLIEEARMPAAVNHLRIGEALLLGRETSFGRRFLGLNQDVFTLRLEVIECKRKPSVPEGRIGLNALGEAVSFEDKGIIRRAILALGAQDCNPDGLTPRVSGVSWLGSSSDHSIYDITRASRDIKVGDTLDFDVNYAALNKLFTSEYVHKFIV